MTRAHLVTLLRVMAYYPNNGNIALELVVNKNINPYEGDKSEQRVPIQQDPQNGSVRLLRRTSSLPPLFHLRFAITKIISLVLYGKNTHYEHTAPNKKFPLHVGMFKSACFFNLCGEFFNHTF
uniref:Ovule protein n=1 Tax=Parascaris univalens TaxID=6257 RepID=A0A915AJK3_PARUN